MQKGKIALFPNLLGDGATIEENFPPNLAEYVLAIDGLIAESEQEGRRFLRQFYPVHEANRIPIALLNKRSSGSDVRFLLEPLAKGEFWGVVSDAGLPCFADPGSEIVAEARRQGYDVQAFVGPSSFVIALLLSGFSAQKFTFHGYLSRHPEERRRQLLAVEAIAKRDRATQLFMEVPYRNREMFLTMVEVLEETTRLCIACDLTLPGQYVETKTIGAWREAGVPEIEKKPTVFLIASSIEIKSIKKPSYRRRGAPRR